MNASPIFKQPILIKDRNNPKISCDCRKRLLACLRHYPTITATHPIL